MYSEHCNCYKVIFLKCIFQTSFQLHIEEKDVERSKLKIDIQGPHDKVDCGVTWKDKTIDCRFIPKESGNYIVSI